MLQKMGHFKSILEFEMGHRRKMTHSLSAHPPKRDRFPQRLQSAISANISQARRRYVDFPTLLNPLSVGEIPNPEIPRKIAPWGWRELNPNRHLGELEVLIKVRE